MVIATTQGLARKHELGQFFTPRPVADFMASCFRDSPDQVRLLDAGAGSGALTLAYVREMCRRNQKPSGIEVTAFEKDSAATPELCKTLDECGRLCADSGIEFDSDIRNEDFISFGVDELKGGLFSEDRSRFNAAIVNPPYRKIRSDSLERLLLRSIGIETGNLYAAFVALVVRLLESDSELVAITPRSFCNGPYFKPFRRELLSSVSLRQIHVFESRSATFRQDDVLQENVIVHAVKGRPNREPVIVSSSPKESPHENTRALVPYSDVVSPDDPHQFIHLTVTDAQVKARSAMAEMSTTLEDLGLSVSTGRVVDFRAKEHLRSVPDHETVPLIYPCHFNHGRVTWPLDGSRKPNAIVNCRATRDLLVPSEIYILTKRFSAKEERRRIVACLFDPDSIKAESVGFENHLNYYHSNGRGLPKTLAKGLFAFLNSSVVDIYFRQFNGHTQVNATDLRSLRYPSKQQLECIGSQVQRLDLSQNEVDCVVEETLRGQR